MLVACRPARLSALEAYYAVVRACEQFGGACGCAARFFWVSANGAAHRFPASGKNQSEESRAKPNISAVHVGRLRVREVHFSGLLNARMASTW